MWKWNITLQWRETLVGKLSIKGDQMEVEGKNRQTEQPGHTPKNGQLKNVEIRNEKAYFGLSEKFNKFFCERP